MHSSLLYLTGFSSVLFEELKGFRLSGGTDDRVPGFRQTHPVVRRQQHFDLTYVGPCAGFMQTATPWLKITINTVEGEHDAQSAWGG